MQALPVVVRPFFSGVNGNLYPELPSYHDTCIAFFIHDALTILSRLSASSGVKAIESLVLLIDAFQS